MNAEQLALCTGCPRVTVASGWLSYLVAAMVAYDISTPARQAGFLAQIGHESGGLQFVREVWGPTPAQSGYEGRADLGNTQPGDGKRFRGHGLIQVTGRGNHARARDRLRAKFPDLDVPDFEADPEALALPEWAALSAADFWTSNGCNRMMDAGDFKSTTRRINGGYNGMNDRYARYAKACEVLHVA